ncbi:hypothetical protein CUMW_236770 [Citrus unshiu]|uniref:Terpene synthase N-terminal domain-containing protein n=1 Tax=Citrus unshiu TaxID=55188 RepID=A0A2H5QJP9_CITUN|nr:hypothetical protein CUMW_236770 [Citrus unshiu]
MHDIQRLGLGYRFENEIKRALDRILSCEQYDLASAKEDLHVAALRFRVLKQQGNDLHKHISLRHSWTMKGKFMETIHNDVKGVLSSHEASYLAFEG